MHNKRYNEQYNIVYGFLSLPFMLIINGLVIMLLWNWFLVPLSVPTIGLWQGAGIGLLVGYVTMHYSQKTNEPWKSRLIFNIIYPTLVLLLGLIVHALM